MPINKTFRNSPEILKPEHIKAKFHKKYDNLIMTFQAKVFPGLLENKLIKEVEDVYFGSSFNKNKIYEVTSLPSTLFFLCPVGAPMAVGMLEEINHVFDIKNIIMYGTCGVLNKEIAAGKVIVPTKAYRDEGTSYHYVESSDFIDITNHQTVYDILSTYNIDMVKGPIWTTDAFYRETIDIFNERKSQGCLAVDMELSAVQAFADLRKLNLYNFVYSADNLDASNWEPRLLGSFTVEDRVGYFMMATRIIEELYAV